MPDSQHERDPAPEQGWVEPGLAAEFPELGLVHTTVPGGDGRTPKSAREQLRHASNRFRGAQAIHLREQAIPWAYRVFFRHIGLDPDSTLTPAEQVALTCMQNGGFVSRSRAEDAVTLAVAESGVAVTVLDADRVEGRLGLRQTGEDERTEGRLTRLLPGTIVIADEARPLAVLFGETGEGRGVDRKTKRTTLVAIRVSGVPDVALEEALWIAAGVMLA